MQSSALDAMTKDRMWQNLGFMVRNLGGFFDL
jgi:hypothetical protein